MHCSARCRRALAVACVVLAVGCTDRASSPERSDSAGAAGGSSGDIDVVYDEQHGPVDRSLTLEEYIEAGLRAHDRRWGGDDAARAATVLAEVMEKDAGQLPRYRSPRSGALFQRLTADENLGQYRNDALSLEARFPDALKYQQATNELFQIYLTAYNRAAVGGDEIVELYGAQLRISAVLVRLVEEFTPTLDKDDPTYAVRMDGLKQMRNGLAAVVASSVETLTETATFEKSQLKRFAGYMGDTFPDLLPGLPPGSCTATLVRLRGFASNPSLQYLETELATLIAIAERCVEAGGAP